MAIPGRKPEPDRTQLTDRENRVRARLDGLDREVVEYQAAQHQRDSYLAAHAADAGQLGRLDRELTHRINTAVGRSALQPHVHALIGPRPSSSDPRALTWINAVQAIETYRHTHDVTDAEHPLGVQPAAGQPLTQWYGIRRTVAAARQDLGLELAPPVVSRPE